MEGQVNHDNPVTARLASLQGGNAQPAQEQQVSTPAAPETAAPESQAGGEQGQENVQQTTAQSEQGGQHIESSQQQEENQQGQEATALENVDDNNASQTQGDGNVEGQAASESSQEDNWWDEGNDIVGEASETLDLPEADYSTIGKAFGLENATGKDVLGKITEMNSTHQELNDKIKNLEENSNFATPELAQANEVARNGGDYMTLLGLNQNNWDTVPDDVLIVEGKLRDAFPNDEEGMMNYLSSMDNVQKQMMASDIRTGLKENDEYQKQQIVRQSQERRQKTDMGIRKALDGMESAYGLKVTAAMKRDLYNSLTGGDFIKSIFHDKDGNPDPTKMVKAAVALGNVDKIAKTAYTKGLNSGTGQVLDEVTNPNVQRQGQMVDPQPKKQASPLEARMNFLANSGQKR